MNKKIYQWHKKAAIISALPLLLWALSGLMHPFIANWFKPQISKRHIVLEKADPSKLKYSLEDLQKIYALDAILQLQLITFRETTYYQILDENRRWRYFNLQTGEESKETEREWAEYLALAYSGFEKGDIDRVDQLDSFTWTYRYINRYLPVYVFEFKKEGLHVMIDPVTAKLASFSNPLSRAYRIFFAIAHNWAFLGEEKSLLRIALSGFFMLLIVYVMITGAFNLWSMTTAFVGGRKRKLSILRKLHRLLGGISLVLLLMLCFSGLFHLVYKLNFDKHFLQSHFYTHEKNNLKLDPLKLLDPKVTSLQKLSLIQVDGESAYRFQLQTSERKSVVEVRHARTGEVIEGADEMYAKTLAQVFTGIDPKQIQKTSYIEKFSPRYSFIFKRLPVWRVHFESAPYLHVTVDTAHSHLSLKTKASDIVETLSFLYLHKFHIFDKWDKELRDYFSVFASIIISALVCVGLGLNFKK